MDITLVPMTSLTLLLFMSVLLGHVLFLFQLLSHSITLNGIGSLSYVHMVARYSFVNQQVEYQSNESLYNRAAFAVPSSSVPC